MKIFLRVKKGFKEVAVEFADADAAMRAAVTILKAKKKDKPINISNDAGKILYTTTQIGQAYSKLYPTVVEPVKKKAPARKVEKE